MDTSNNNNNSSELEMFPVDIFKVNLTDEIHREENGISLQETIKVLDYKLLYKSLHLTQNLHTADWNSCVFRRCVQFLEHHALTYEDINNARVAYQAYEAGDMKGMVLSQHVLMRALKMCNKTISPMKLMHRIKHSQAMYDEPGRIQLYEFLDLLLWADGYKGYIPDETYGHFEMEDNLFKLTDFDHLLAHHDARVASRLDAQYLKDEWEFPGVKVKDKPRLKDGTVICGDSRVEMTRHQKQSYRHIRSEVGKSQKMVHCVKGGFVRERPVTAPSLGMYSQKEVEALKRRQSERAQSIIYTRLQNLLRQAYSSNANASKEHVDMSDRPVLEEYKRCHTPKIISDSELQEMIERWQQLLFDIETEVISDQKVNRTNVPANLDLHWSHMCKKEGRYEIAMETEMEAFIPKYKQRKNEGMENNKETLQAKKKPAPTKKANQYEAAVNSLAYPIPRIPPSHAHKCDARFRGWYGARSKKGQHYILMSPFFHDSPKGQLFRKLAKMSDAEIRKLHGDLISRRTKSHDIDQRPVTAPAVMTMEEYQSKMKALNMAEVRGENSKQSQKTSVSMEDSSGKLFTSSTSKQGQDLESPEPNLKGSSEIDIEILHGREKSDPQLGQFAESRDGIETSLSDKIRLMATENENTNIMKSEKPRAQSAYVQRHDQLQNGDSLHLKAEDGRYPRSKSVAGTCNIPDVEDVAPMPYMDHSKPKKVSVGSIGKISLLESISEAKYWEDLVLEQQREKTKAAKAQSNSVVEKEGILFTPESVGEEAVDDSFIEEKISSHSKKKKSKKKPGESNDESDILSLIIEEEKRRKNRARSYNKKPKFGYSNAKPWSCSSASSRASRIGSSNSKSSSSSGKTSQDPNKPTEHESAADNIKGNPVNDSKQISQKCDEKGNSVQKKVTLIENHENRKTSTKPSFGKYERLVKRLGDDISPYMKKQMLKIASS